MPNTVIVFTFASFAAFFRHQKEVLTWTPVVDSPGGMEVTAMFLFTVGEVLAHIVPHTGV